MRFQNKTALVTGAASGMGFLTSRLLREEGAHVVMLDICEEALPQKAAEIGADYRVTDVRRYEEIAAAVAYAKETYGGVDMVIRYAGGAASRVCRDGHAFPDMAMDAIDWGIDVNFRAPMYLARAVFPLMREAHSGVIVNIGSIDGVTGSSHADSSAEKAGLIGLTRSLAYLGGPYNVRCVCVSPGPVLTRPNMATMKTRLGRAAEVKEVVDLVLYLCSEQGAFITGANYLIDGGRACASMCE